jgi:hypothetical protein
MLGKLLLIGFTGAAAFGVSRILKASGAVESGANKAAGALRERGPGVLENVAQGIEKVGTATEKGVQTLSERMANGESGEASGGETSPNSESPSVSSSADDPR